VLRIRIIGEEHVRRAFNAGGTYIAHPDMTMRDIQLNVHSVIRNTFHSQGRRYGGSWQKLSDRWAKRKADLGWDARTLFGKPGTPLYTAFATKDAPEQHAHVTGSDIEIDTDIEYADVHQFGGLGWGGSVIPARPFIVFDERDVDRWIKMLEKDLGRAMRGAGGRQAH
jgi:phage gpG-like protein